MNLTTIYKILRWASVALAVLLLIGWCATDETTTAVEFSVLNEAVCAHVDQTAMTKAEADRLERVYGLNAEDYVNFALYLPSDSMVYVEELLLVELKDDAQKDAVLAAIDDRLNTQKNTFENYNLFGQYEKLTDHAHVEVCGRFILFTVNADDAWQAFLDTV